MTSDKYYVILILSKGENKYEKIIFFQTKLYDYTTKKEAEKHIEEMRTKGWVAKRQNNGEFVFENGQDEFLYSVEFFKER